MASKIALSATDATCTPAICVGFADAMDVAPPVGSSGSSDPANGQISPCEFVVTSPYSEFRPGLDFIRNFGGGDGT